MSGTGEDVALWKWIVGLVMAALSGLVTGSWSAGAKVKGVDMEIDILKADVKVLKDARAAQPERCEKNQERIIMVVTEKLCSSFRELMKDETIRSTKELAEINKNLALLVQSQHTTQDDITEIFARLNKRKFQNPSDTGQRRRYTDVME